MNEKNRQFDASLYEHKLSELLRCAHSLNEFTNIVSNEVSSVGLNDWGYYRLDMPYRLAPGIGNLSKTYTDCYINNQYYDCDMLYNYDSSREFSVTFYQSSIVSILSNYRFKNQQFDTYKEYAKKCRTLGYQDIFYIISPSLLGGGDYVFLIPNKGHKTHSFKQAVVNSTRKLELIAKLVDRIGIEKYPEVFVTPRSHYHKLRNSPGFKLLNTIINDNITQEDAVVKLGMTNMEADNALKVFREQFNTKTTLTALCKAQARGYFSENFRNNDCATFSDNVGTLPEQRLYH